MPDSTQLGKTTVWMAVVWGILFSSNALTTCMVAVLANSNWPTLDGFHRFLICAAIFGNWTTVIMAFLSKTIARMEAGKPPIVDPANGDTEFLKKSDVQAVLDKKQDQPPPPKV